MRGKRCHFAISPVPSRITPAGAGKTRSLPEKRLLTQDHPRRCGENYAVSMYSLSALGSPPQVRGKRCIAGQLGQLRRITPAGAGKTDEHNTPNHSAQDHPRRCGENSAAKHLTSAGTGSPPQVRGKPDSDHRPWQGTGITPAGAGKTERLILDAENLEDHPRRCGENVVRSQILLMHLWITPAGAGKTPDDIQFRTADEDHPRRCGENFPVAINMVNSRGSPPQVRGKPSDCWKTLQELRITPAGAGKTCSLYFSLLVFKDHPRRCGENGY